MQHDGSWSCWGAYCVGSDVYCTPFFVSGKGHFKNKFCPSCRAMVQLPVSRTRALTETQKEFCKCNGLNSGFWKAAPAELGGTAFRIMNNTAECTGPWIVLFQVEPPSGIEWQKMPAGWVVDDALQMTVAKGTLVPVSEMIRRRAHQKSPPVAASPPGRSCRLADLEIPIPIPIAALSMGLNSPIGADIVWEDFLRELDMDGTSYDAAVEATGSDAAFGALPSTSSDGDVETASITSMPNGDVEGAALCFEATGALAVGADQGVLTCEGSFHQASNGPMLPRPCVGARSTSTPKT